VSVEVVKLVALALTLAVPKFVAPSENTTVPVGAGAVVGVVGVIVAVKVTGEFTFDTGCDETSARVVPFCRPVPVTVMSWGLPAALFTTLKLALINPTVTGSKTTSSVQLMLAGTLTGKVTPHVPLGARAKLGEDGATDESVKAAFPEFVIVTV
jgi:hypothetical protein